MKTGHLMGNWDPENRFFISAFAKAGSDDDPQECLKVAELPYDGNHPMPLPGMRLLSCYRNL